MALLIVGLLGMIVAFYLHTRIDDLERKVDELSARSTTPMIHPATQPHVVTGADDHTRHITPEIPHAVVPPPAPMAAVPPPATVLSAREPESPNAFFEWLQQDVFMKLGALLLLIAFGWFVSYAFANNWIGPAGRIALGLVAGVGLLTLGVWRIERFREQGTVFALLGSTVVLLTVFAARSLYDYFTPATGLLVMMFSIVLVAYLAVAYRHNVMALMSLVLGAIAPLLLAAPEPNTFMLLSYVLVLVLGSLWVMQYLHHDGLILSAFLVAVLYTAPYLFESSGGVADTSIALIFGFIFVGVFLFSNCLSMVLRAVTDTALGVQVFIAVANGMYLVSWIYYHVAEEWQAVLYSLWAFIFAFLAFVVFIYSQRATPFYVHGAVAIGLIGAATVTLFSGATLTIVLTLEIATLVLLTAFITHNAVVAQRLGLLFCIPGALTVQNILSSSWQSGVLHVDFFVILIFALTLVFVMVCLRALAVAQIVTSVPRVVGFAVSAGFYAVTLVWLITHALLPDDGATFMALLIYTISGLTLYVYGVSSKQSGYRLAGGVLVGLVMVRLLSIDVWQMALTGRIITFAVIGTVLMATAFIAKFQQPK